jgi:hypothetical protein
MLNLKPGSAPSESRPAAAISPEAALRSTVLAHILFGNQFHEHGVTVAGRIALLVPQVDAAAVAALVVETRKRSEFCSVPLLLVREMALHHSHRALVAATLVRVIQRPGDICEFVAIYWRDRRQPLSAQVKKGLAAAFTKFDGPNSRNAMARALCGCAMCSFSATRGRGISPRRCCGRNGPPRIRKEHLPDRKQRACPADRLFEIQ